MTGQYEETGCSPDKEEGYIGDRQEEVDQDTLV